MSFGTRISQNTVQTCGYIVWVWHKGEQCFAYRAQNSSKLVEIAELEGVSGVPPECALGIKLKMYKLECKLHVN